MRAMSWLQGRWRRRRERRGAALPQCLFEHLPGTVMLVDAEGVILDVAPGVEAHSGHPADTLLGRRVTGLDEDPLRGELARALALCVSKRRSWQGVVRCRRADGGLRDQDTLVQPLNEGPDGLRLLIVQHDVSAFLEPARRKSDRLLRLEDTVARLPGALFRLRQSLQGDLAFDYLSQGISALCGQSAEAVMAVPERLLDRLHAEDRDALRVALAQSAVSLVPLQLAMRIEAPGGERWLEASALPRREDDGEILWDGWLQDVTRRKEDERQTQRLISTDMLTGLLNRRAFFANGVAVQAHAARHRRRLPVAMLDLDHFKALNDTYGHAAGDSALQHFAQTCRDCLRPYDLIARLGGEEFAVILSDSDPEEARSVFERLRAAVAENRLVLDGEEVRMTVSLGLTFLEPDGDLDEALCRADRALYRAKREGRNRIAGPEPEA